VEIRVKTLPWSVQLITLKRDLMETMELTPNKLNILCKVDWPDFGVGWTPERSLDKTNLLYWHNKTFLPANCFKSPISQLANSPYNIIDQSSVYSFL
jgi:hypothetical protein